MSPHICRSSHTSLKALPAFNPNPWRAVRLVEKVDAIGNVACFTYDGLHRVTGVSYPNASTSTPTKVFVYDTATVNGTAMVLTAGRLAEAYTCTTCGPTPTKLTDTSEVPVWAIPNGRFCS